MKLSEKILKEAGIKMPKPIMMVGKVFIIEVTDESEDVTILNLKKLSDIMNNCQTTDDFFDEIPTSILNIFYNTPLPELNWKQTLVKIFNYVLSGKNVITSWEEGTTGLGINKKSLSDAANIADAKAMKGMGPDDTINKFIK